METLEGGFCDSESLSTLKVVDLSRTNIQSLPPSVSKITSLVNLTLRECSMLTELPPEIGKLKNLKMFDLEGTEIMYLPKEMCNLENLECLRVSLCTYANEYKDSNGIEYIIPRTLILNLRKLEELSIGINPNTKWWEVELVEAILVNLHMLSCLKTLKLYFPSAKELRYLLRHENIQPPIYSRLRDFRLKVGHTEQLASCLPSQIVEGFDQLEKCLKYENDEASLDEIEELIGHANALFMRRHWTLEKLSIFDISKLKYCLVAECNEMHTIVDAQDVYGKRSTFNHDKKFAFDSVEHLAIYSMKKLQSIWKGPILGNCFTLLQVLALHTCPNLTTVFTEGMLNKLNRLTVLIVEDCPKVETLVSREDTSTRKSYGPFLPKLKNILLLDLPELVSISNGVCIASQLDTLIVFNCLKFGDLNRSGLSNDVRKIIGETEWWDALKGRRSIHSRAFLPLKRDGDLTNRLSEDTNSLKQFLKLQYQGEALFTSGSNSVHLDRSQPLPNQQKNKPRHIVPYRVHKRRLIREDQQEQINKIEMYHIISPDTLESAIKTLSNPFSSFKLIMQDYFKRNYPSIRSVHSRFADLLDDDHLKWTTMSPKMISDLRSIAIRVNSIGNVKRCVEIYISQRKNILQIFKPSTFEIEFRDGIQKFEWKILESLIQDWIKLVKICLDYSLFAKEKRLCEQIFEGLETTIDDIVYMVIIQDYEIHVSNIVYTMNLSNPPPDKLFMILDLYETLDRFLSEMCVVIKPKDPAFGNPLFPVLTNYITNSLSMFETVLLYHQSSVIFVGPVDPLPEYVMSYLCQLCDNKKPMMKLSLQVLPTVDTDDVTNLNYEEFKGQSDMSCHVIWIIMILVSNLESGAKLCEDGSAGHFFAMKNIGYVVQKIEGHSELMEVVGDGYLGKLIQKLNLIKLKYLMLEIEKMRDMRNYSVMV